MMLRQADRKAYTIFIRQGLFILLAVGVSGFFILFFPSGAHFVILLFSLSLISVGIRKLYPYFRAKKWIKLQATILDIQEVEESVIQSESGPSKYYYPVIVYQYEYMDSQFQANQVCFEKQNIWLAEYNLWGDKLREQDKFWCNWQVGSEIPVFINPRNPGQSVLITELSPKHRSHHYAIALSGVLLFVVWLGILVLI